MRQIKRLDRPPENAFQKLQRGALRSGGVSEDQLRSLERSRPDLIIEDGDAVLAGHVSGGTIELAYAFGSSDTFHERFSRMFEQLTRACSDEDAPFGYRFRLTERSSRSYVEPILITYGFELSREWMSMELVPLPEDAPTVDAIAPGFLLRAVTREDVPALIELEEHAFPSPQLTPDIIKSSMKTAAFYRVLEETSTKRLAGSLVGELRETRSGHIAVLAVHPDVQRRGLGAAMTRWALAQFRSQGARRATLTTNVDNSPAIALYRKLGFAPAQFGLDYRRPVDEEEVRQVLEKNRAQHISVNRRGRR